MTLHYETFDNTNDVVNWYPAFTIASWPYEDLLTPMHKFAIRIIKLIAHSNYITNEPVSIISASNVHTRGELTDRSFVLILACNCC